MPTHSDRSNPSPDRGRARGRRYEPTPIYDLAERLARQGVKLHKIPGPWRPERYALRRPGRNAERTISIVTNACASGASVSPARSKSRILGLDADSCQRLGWFTSSLQMSRFR